MSRPEEKHQSSIFAVVCLKLMCSVGKCQGEAAYIKLELKGKVRAEDRNRRVMRREMVWRARYWMEL